MKKQKLLTIALSLSMVFGAGMSAFADTTDEPVIPKTPASSVFADMPDDWSTKALENAVSNGLLNGYDVKGEKLIKPDGKLTRAEMATIMNNAFGSTEKADMTGVNDVVEGKWYTDHMAVSVQMGGLSKAAKMRPDDKITREEAFTVLAKVFNLEDSQDYAKLDTYSDHDKITAYAKDRIAALLNADYISGDNGSIKPLANITRAEFAAVMNNIVKQYVKESGEVTEAADGNILVRAGDVTLKDVEMSGELILADGIADGSVTLENVTVSGTAILRSGSLVVNEGSTVENVLLACDNTIVTGEGTVKNATINGNNSQVNTNNTKITVAEGVTGASSGSSALEAGSTHTSASDTSGQTPFDPDKTPVVTAPVIGMTGSENPVMVTVQQGFAENLFGLITETFEDNAPKVTAVLTKGSEEYKNVRLVVSAQNGSDLSDLQLIVKDPGSDKYYNFVGAGWGPLEGFELADYTAEVSMIAKTAGTYSFKVQLIDCSDQNKVIVESETYTIIAQ